MPEETSTEATATETATATAETASVSLVGKDGNFVKDWHKLLKDESLHGDKTLPNFKEPETLAKSYVHIRKQVPLDKIAIPNDATSDEEWDAWHTAGGRPPAAVDYNITRPEDFPEEHWNADLALAAQDLFHKIGLNQKQVAALMEFNNANVLTAMKAQVDAIVSFRQESKNKLMQEEGNAYEQRRHMGNYAIEKGTNGDNELRDRWLQTPLKDGGVIGDLVDTSRILSNIGSKFAEHGDIVSSKIATPGDIQEQITKIMADPKYTHKDKRVRQPLIDKIMKLREELRQSTNR